MEIRDRIKELLDMCPRFARGDGSHQPPGQPEVFGESFIAHASGVLLANLSNNVGGDDRLRIPFASVGSGARNSVQQVLRASDILKIFNSIVRLVGVDMVDLHARWARSNVGLDNNSMYEPTNGRAIKLKTRNTITSRQRLLGNNPAGSRPPAGCCTSQLSVAACFVIR